MTAADAREGAAPGRRALIAAQVAALYVLPNLLLATGAVPAAYRFWVFGVGMAIPLLEMLLGRWSPRRLGFRADTLVPYLLPYVLFTTILTVGLLVLARLLGKIPAGHPLDWWSPSLTATIVALSFFQEICFRGYLWQKLNVVLDGAMSKIIVNALLFSWLHVFYPDPLFSMAITFVAGLGFAAMFNSFPNMWLVSASHAVLNRVSTLYCFLSIGGACVG